MKKMVTVFALTLVYEERKPSEVNVSLLWKTVYLAAPAPYSAPAAYYFPNVARMEAVEVLKGSSQVQYGPFTTGGAINLVSTPIPNNLSGKAENLLRKQKYV